MGAIEGPAWEWVGSGSPRIRVAGHSHSQALRYAMERLDPSEKALVAVLDVAAEPLLADDTYWPVVASTGRPVVVLWNGNQPNVVFMMSDDPITVIGPRGVLSEPIGRVIPYSMVKALWNPWLADLLQFLEGHPDPSLVTLLGTPPPKAEAEVRAGIAIEPYFVDLLAAQDLTPDTAPIVDTATRVATWDALQERMAEVTADFGMRFLPVPPEAHAADGTLPPQLSGPDATHANLDYGLMMWRHLIKKLVD